MKKTEEGGGGGGRVLASIGCHSGSQGGKNERGKFERGSLKSKIAIRGPSGVTFFTAHLR